MPIGDLLAEISGGQPSSAPSPKAPSSSSGIKRKAESGSDGATSTKLTKARQPDGSYSTSKVTRDGEGRVIERSYSVSRPVKASGSGQASTMNSATLPHRTSSHSTNGRHEPRSSTPSSQRMASISNGKSPATSSNAAQPKRPSEASSRPKLNQSALATTKIAPSRPSPTTPNTPDSSRAPKKGSFKEIMARGAKAQEVMGKVGMIQHKSIDKGMVKKEREVSKPEPRPGAGQSARGKAGAPYTGTSRPSTAAGRDHGSTGASGRTASRNGPSKDVKAGGKSKSGSAANDVVEKKVKKSATATTGYAGTARPRPGATANKGSSSKGDQRPGRGGLLEPPQMGRRSKYEDEYDEDLDDFIDYDDEEEQEGGPRYYDSDGSSDMEAGMSDIDTEERRAELYAREEDRREQALEEKLKKEKEERKRRWAHGGR
ncbi:hypothetical protein O1611_g1969 [Lasiodiplodia mahajangana]|uniref:Uncharacterized protein n=1 Tax=Lasiodiplodia mahajangana TaxID=1108764 RepID=A0ACC2JW18_9PEZI|nr:hypothetical protein O1611_g1969 [Lasiodiplodia mahajangana]